MAALEFRLKLSESEMRLHMLLQDVLSWNTAHPPLVRELFIPYAEKAHRMRGHDLEQRPRPNLPDVSALRCVKLSFHNLAILMQRALLSAIDALLSFVREEQAICFT